MKVPLVLLQCYFYSITVLLFEPINISNVSSKLRHLQRGWAALSAGCCEEDAVHHIVVVSCLFKCGLRRPFMNETMWSKHHLTSGASDHRLKQARKEWIYLETCQKARRKKNISPTVSVPGRLTIGEPRPSKVGERRRFHFWWVSCRNPN